MKYKSYLNHIFHLTIIFKMLFQHIMNIKILSSLYSFFPYKVQTVFYTYHTAYFGLATFQVYSSPMRLGHYVA
jgi:hypothetical protein